MTSTAPKRIQAVLFDIDGTLVDSNDMHVLAWEEAFAGIGQHVERSAIHAQIGKGADMLIPALLPDLDGEDRQKLEDAHAALFKAQYLGEAAAFPQVRALLAYTHGCGQRVVLASSASSSELKHYIDLLDASDLVAATASSDEVKHTKPAPDIFATAMHKLPDIDPARMIAVGDTPYDMEAAAQCGIAAIGLLSGGFADEVLRRAGPIAVYDDAAALLADYDRSPLGALDAPSGYGPADNPTGFAGRGSSAEADDRHHEPTRAQNREVEDEMVKVPGHDGEPPISATEPN